MPPAISLRKQHSRDFLLHIASRILWDASHLVVYPWASLGFTLGLGAMDTADFSRSWIGKKGIKRWETWVANLHRWHMSQNGIYRNGLLPNVPQATISKRLGVAWFWDILRFFKWTRCREIQVCESRPADWGSTPFSFVPRTIRAFGSYLVTWNKEH